MNLEQEITTDMGFFMRLGWNDGKTQDFAFTAIDRLASGGVSVKGTKWKRKDDVAATSFTASGASGVHALYLARGGLDFLIGDGRLNYAPEYVWESYYSARLFPGFFATFDLQHDNNLAFNHDRGPRLDREPAAAHGVWAASLVGKIAGQIEDRAIMEVDPLQQLSDRAGRALCATLPASARRPRHTSCPPTGCRASASAARI